MNTIKLNQLIKQASTFEAGNRDQFRALINLAIDAFERLQLELADEFGVNPSSLSRWKTGKVAPHPLSQQMLASWLVEKAQAQCDQAAASAPAPRGNAAATEQVSMVAKSGD